MPEVCKKEVKVRCLCLLYEGQQWKLKHVFMPGPVLHLPVLGRADTTVWPYIL